MQKLKHQKMLEEIGKEIKIFLMKHGGMSNNYDTWADGIVEGMGSDRVEINTPVFGKLTKDEIEDLGNELADNINDIREKHNFEGKIYIKHHSDAGTESTVISVMESLEINLWNNNKHTKPTHLCPF